MQLKLVWVMTLLQKQSNLLEHQEGPVDLIEVKNELLDRL